MSDDSSTIHRFTREELYDLEKAALAELWDELVRKPVLDAFDAAMADVLKH